MDLLQDNNKGRKMAYRYEVNENNEVFIYTDEQEEPIIHQPFWPNGELFTKEEAENWGKTKVSAFDPNFEFDAGGSREEPIVKKYTAEEIRLWKLHATGLTVDDLKALLNL